MTTRPLTPPASSAAAPGYLVVAPELDRIARFSGEGLAAFTERHHFSLPLTGFVPAPAPLADTLLQGAGTVMMLSQGLPGSAQLKLAKELIARGQRVFLYWPSENAIERIDRERLSSLRRHRLAFIAATKLRAWQQRRNARAAAASISAAPLPAAGGGPVSATADSAAALSVIEHMGREAESIEGHLKGGTAELRRGLGAHLGEVNAHAEAAAAQLEAARAAIPADGGREAASGALDATQGALSNLGHASRNLQAFGETIADYVEGGFPVLERIRQQSAVAADLVRTLAPLPPAAAPAPVDLNAGPYGESDLASVQAFLRSIAEDARPVPFRFDALAEEAGRIPGTGVYLRLDFWASLISGGSYGHTCYQAEALAQATGDFVAVNANRFELLETLGVRQVVVPGRDMTQTEANILGMNRHYTERLGLLFHAMRPAYIFERAVLGSAVGAWASRRFEIPYIVEYNGSEISMKRSFAGEGYAHEDLLLLAEDAAFRQATMISVVSDHVAADVARRGIPEERILVNPNAVDLEAYAPAAPEARRALRAELGFTDAHTVVGFIGTFGGWHGIDVLAASLQAIMAGDPAIRYLLIGDGNLKSTMTEAIAAHGLEDRVVDVGRVAQAKGAELLKACDILVSPHSRNMVDSPFFGSPTKLFEYMGMGAGIVASDLEQIAHVLSPALRPAEFASGAPAVGDHRAVLCRPGDADDFAAGVLALARHPETSQALGRNARAAAERYYTWRQHVRNLWLALSGRSAEGYAVDRRSGGGA